MSKALATVATQPLIVAKVGLQSRPPPAREGKPFKTFSEVMSYIVEHEGPMALFKGIGPQLMKGLLVQGLLMMTKERYVSVIMIVCPSYRFVTNTFDPGPNYFSLYSSVRSGSSEKSS
jgi:hypothetical protein